MTVSAAISMKLTIRLVISSSVEIPSRPLVFSVVSSVWKVYWL